jgi:putative ABC transport system permease protein
MLFPDLLHLAFDSVTRARMRSAMLLLAMGIGVAAVVVLTALGEGARRYVTGEFQALGTRMVIVLPGRSETSGLQPGMMTGQTPRPLRLADAQALLRIGDVERVAPVVIGSVPASVGERSRDVPVFGSNSELQVIQGFKLRQGEFLPRGELDRDQAVCVIGGKVAAELFPGRSALGESLRLGDRRFRVIGVMSDEGRMIGIDSGETIIIPVSSALALFNSESLFRILVQVTNREAMPRVRARVEETIRLRHQGELDVTVITQDAVLATFDRIFTALTMTLAGIASISLLVAGVLVMNVMLVAVSQRTSEVGLLKALGATQRQITALFLAEAICLSLVGACAGIAVGLSVNWAVGAIYPALPLVTPAWAFALAIATALASGIGFGLLPARRAAKLDPVVALAGKR